jgi:hypothetical protein
MRKENLKSPQFNSERQNKSEQDLKDFQDGQD